MITGQELESTLTEFLHATREADSTYRYYTDLENENNNQTQDILHAIEIAPEVLDGINLMLTLQRIRQERRDAKQKIAIAKRFYDWVSTNKKVIKSLEEVLGDIRKEIRKQPAAAYSWRSNLICEKGSWLQKNTEVFFQPTFPEWDDFFYRKEK